MTQGQRIQVVGPDGTVDPNCSIRIKYDPEWCASRPYCTFVGGSAEQIFPTLGAAKQYIKDRFRDVRFWSQPY